MHMPTILRTGNLRFIIYPNDHPPAHIHILGPDAECKIQIKDIKLISSKGFSLKDIKRISHYISENIELISSAWEDIHE